MNAIFSVPNKYIYLPVIPFTKVIYSVDTFSKTFCSFLVLFSVLLKKKEKKEKENFR